LKYVSDQLPDEKKKTYGEGSENQLLLVEIELIEFGSLRYSDV